MRWLLDIGGGRADVPCSIEGNTTKRSDDHLEPQNEPFRSDRPSGMCVDGRLKYAFSWTGDRGTPVYGKTCPVCCAPFLKRNDARTVP